MSNGPTNSDVRISVQRKSTDSDADTSEHGGIRVREPEYTLVVPIVDELPESKGINVHRLLQTAVALAADNDGKVLLLGIASVEDEAVLEKVREDVQSDGRNTEIGNVSETTAERQSQLGKMVGVAREIDSDVPVNAVVRTVTNITEGILSTVDEEAETAILMLRGTSLDESWLLSRSTKDVIIDEAECDVFVEKVTSTEGANALYVPDIEDHTVASLAQSEARTIDSILLAVGTGPHSALASEAARAVARAADASIKIFHVVSPDAASKERAEAKEVLKFAENIIGDNVATETELREATDKDEEIVKESRAHDFICIGYPEADSLLEQFVFEPVQESLLEGNEGTILMARDSDPTMRSLFYHWKNSLDAMEEDTEAAN